MAAKFNLKRHIRFVVIDVQDILDHKKLTGLAGKVKIWLRSPLEALQWVKDPWNGQLRGPFQRSVTD